MKWLIISQLSLFALGSGLLWAHAKRKKKMDAQLEEQRVEAVKTKKIMEELIATAGWKLIVQAAEAQKKQREDQVLLRPTENAYMTEFMKGEVQGIRLLIAIPGTIIETSQEIIKATRQVQEEGDE